MFDEQLYLIAYNDFAGKAVDEALWIKAMTLAGGDKKRAKWHYIELRVDQMLRDPPEKISPAKNQSYFHIRSLHDLDQLYYCTWSYRNCYKF